MTIPSENFEIELGDWLRDKLKKKREKPGRRELRAYDIQ